jgi:uncharacterized integral membrane protein
MREKLLWKIEQSNRNNEKWFIAFAVLFVLLVPLRYLTAFIAGALIGMITQNHKMRAWLDD